MAAVSGKLIFQDEEVAVGDTVPAKIIFNIQGMDSDFHDEDFLNKTLSESFYVSEVKEHHVSENNHDMYEVSVLLTIIRSFIPGHEQIIQLGHQDLRLGTDEKLSVVKFSEDLPKDFIFIESRYALPLDPQMKRLLVVGIVVLLLVLVYWLWRRQQKTKIREMTELQFNNLKRKWNSLFLNAVTRDHFETLFAGKSEWERLLEKGSLLSEYKKNMEKYIYKKNWEQTELDQVGKIHQDLMRNFKSGI